MTNTKRWSKEPDRTPLQTRASHLLGIIFVPSHSSRGKRSSTARPRPDLGVTVEDTPEAHCLKQAGERKSSQEALRCSSPTLEFNTIKENAPLDQQLLPGSLLQLDSLHEADFDLQDLILDEDEVENIGMYTGGAKPAATGAAACSSAGDTVPAGAFLCQQLAQQLSDQQRSILAQHQEQRIAKEPDLQQQQLQQQSGVTDVFVATAAAVCNDPTSSPAFDGTAFIVESSTTIPSQLVPEPGAVPVMTCAAAASDHDGHTDNFIAVDKMLEQLTVDAMLNQQCMMEQWHQQHFPPAAADRVHTSPFPAAPAVDLTSSHGEHAAAGAAASQQHYQQQVSHNEQQCMPAVPFHTSAHKALSVFQLPTPEVEPPQQQQQQVVLSLGAAASLPPALDGSNSRNIDTAMSPQQQLQVSAAILNHQQHLGNSADQSQTFSFQALLMDETMAQPAATTAPYQQQQLQQPRYAQTYQPTQHHHHQQHQHEEIVGLEGTPAGNYRLLQQHQQQRRQQQQLQYSQLHTAYSAPAPEAAEALTGARSLPHSLQTFTTAAAPGLLETAHSQPVQPVSENLQGRVNSAYHSNSRNSVCTGQTITHSSHTVTTFSAGIHGNCRPTELHVTGSGQQMQGYYQQLPQQQLSATQQELLALKQQLAEEKRRRKEKKKLRRMQKMLQEQHQQQQGHPQRQQSGLSQQVLFAASQQQKVANNSPSAAASAARGHQTTFSTAVPQAGTGSFSPHQTPAGPPTNTLGTTSPSHTLHLHRQPWRTTSQPQHSRQQQPAGNSISSIAAKYPQGQVSAAGTGVPAASPHAWQHRRGSNSNPHAAAVDSPSVSRQHAVAQSLRQLADRFKQQQQTGGSGHRDSAANSAAAGGFISQQSPTRPCPGHNSSAKYSPDKADVYPHSFSHPHSHPYSRSLTQGPGEPAGLNQGKEAAGVCGPGFGHAMHQSVLPGVPIVLDLGDKPEPDSQTAGAPDGQPQQDQDKLVLQAHWRHTTQQQQQRTESDEGRSYMATDMYSPEAGHGMAAAVCSMDPTTNNASIRAFQHQQQMPHTYNSFSRRTPPLTYHDSCATGTAAGSGAAVSSSSAHQASLKQHNSRAGELQAVSTGDGASPLSTISSGRKRSFDQTHTTPSENQPSQASQQLQQYNSSHAAGPPAAPSGELQVLVHKGQPAAADLHLDASRAQQQQQPDLSNKHQARLLQLPFNGPDLAERRDRERERTPHRTPQAASNLQPKQPIARSDPLDSSPPVTGGQSSNAACAATDSNKLTTSMHLPAKQAETCIMHGGGSDWCSTAVPAGYDANVTSCASAQQTTAGSFSYAGDLRPAMVAPSAAAAAREMRPRGLTLDGSALASQGPGDFSMPPPPPHTQPAAPARARTNSTVVTAGGGGCLSPGDCGGPQGNTASCGFSAVLGSGNVYRTSSGKVLRMLTHPVTGKPLLLGPAVDAKSSRLGNTSLGAPAPQLFGLELQTTSSHGGGGLGTSAGSISGVSGGASLGSPGTSSSVRADGNSSKPRRQSNTGSKARKKVYRTAAAAAASNSLTHPHVSNPTAQKPALPIAPSGLGFVAFPASPHLAVGVPGLNPACTGTIRQTSNYAGVSVSTVPVDLAANASASSLMFCDSTYQDFSEAQCLGAPFNLGPSSADGWGSSWDACAAIQGPSADQSAVLMDMEPYAVQQAVAMPGDEAAAVASLM